jgi:hypothetical protein
MQVGGIEVINILRREKEKLSTSIAHKSNSRYL